MADLAKKLGDPPDEPMPFRDFLEHLQRCGFTHLDGVPLKKMLAALTPGPEAAEVLQYWLPPVTDWLVPYSDENRVHLRLLLLDGRWERASAVRKEED